MILIFTGFGIDKLIITVYCSGVFWVLSSLDFPVSFLLHRLLSATSSGAGRVRRHAGLCRIKMFFDKSDKKINTSNHVVVRWSSKVFRVSRELDGHNFFIPIKTEGVHHPAVFSASGIEFSDVIFCRRLHPRSISH
jgi:hypothetical protein